MLDHRARGGGGGVHRVRAFGLPVLSMAIAALGVAGCSGGSGGSPGGPSSAPASGGGSGSSSQYSASQLQSGLLTSVPRTAVSGNGAVKRVAAPKTGTIGSLGAGTTALLARAKVTPAQCKMLGGLSDPALKSAPAAVVAFAGPPVQYSEVLVSAPGSAASTAMRGVPPACHHYTVSLNGETATLTYKDEPAPSVGQDARAFSTNTGSADSHGVIFRAGSYVCEVIVSGPPGDASAKAAAQLAKAAYTQAQQSLH